MKKEIQQGKESKNGKTAETKGVRAIRKTTHYKRAPVRLWVRSKFLGFRRNREVQRPTQPLLKLEGVNDVSSAQHYFGKRVVYIYKATNSHQGSKFRTIWGRIAKAHGEKGVVVAKFSPNLPSRAMGGTIRVMLYPNRD